MRKLNKLVVFALVAVMSISAISCSNAKDDSDAKETTTVDYGPEFDKEVAKYSEYIKDTYKGEYTQDGPNTFSYHLDKDGETMLNVGLSYYKTEAEAEAYVTRASEMFNPDTTSEYAAGDYGIIYEPANDDTSEGATILPTYIFVRDGASVWYAVYYEGYKEDADNFISAMSKAAA